MKLHMLLIAVTALCSCTDSPRQKLPCKEYDTKCELQKTHQFVKVIETLDENIVDAYGAPLVVGEWYFRSSAAKTLTPVSYHIDNFTLNDFEYADQGHGKIAHQGNVEADTVTIRCTSTQDPFGAQVRVRLLKFGPNYVNVRFDGEKPTFAIYTGE